MFGTGYIHVLYLGRAPHTKEIFPDFREKCQVTRHSRVFHGLTGSQQTLGFRVSQLQLVGKVKNQYPQVIGVYNGIEIRLCHQNCEQSLNQGNNVKFPNP